ncbi:MAG: hypothetical protein JW889_02900 [Verrucomicrobia bacterium]|nr:hypothetical protein [Verrucomicrobiota bacterium]
MNDDVRYIERRLRGLQGSKRWFYVTFGAAVVLAVVCLGSLVLSSVDLHVSVAQWLRTLLFAGLVLSGLVLVAGLVVVPILRWLGILKLSWDVEETFPDLRATLATTVEYTVDPYGRTHYTSDEMKEALAGQTRERISVLPLRRSVRWARVRWPFVALVALVVGLGLFAGLVPNGRTALLRAITPWQERTFTQLDVQPGSVECEELSDLTIYAELSGRIPDEATIHFENDKGEWISEKLDLERGRVRHMSASFEFTRLSSPFSYYVEAGDATSPTYEVIVYPDPKVDAISAELLFPAYTQLPKQTIKKGDIVALRGTKVTLNAHANTKLDRARLVRADGTVVPLAISENGRNASGAFTVEQDGLYEIVIEDEYGHVNRQRKQYAITALKDTVPDVRIIHPGQDMKVTKTSEVPIEFEVADDYGISKIGLALNVRMEGEQRQIVQEFDTRTLNAQGEAVIMLEDYPLEPHDIVSYYVFAIDNDAIAPSPKQGRSTVYFLEIMPYEERYRLKEGSGLPMAPKLDVLGELIRIQKEVIQKTFGVLNALTDPIEPEVEERIMSIASLEFDNALLARDFAVTLQAELLALEMENEIGKVQAIERAADFMDAAVLLLHALDTQGATDPEQQALGALYKALADLEHLVSQDSSSMSEAQKKEQLRQALELAQKKAAEMGREREEERREKLEEQKSEIEELKDRQHDLNEEMASQAEQQKPGAQPSTQPQSGSESTQSKEGQGEGEGKGEGEGQGQGLPQRQRQLADETKAAASELAEMAKKDPSLSSKAPTSAEKASAKMDEAAEQLDKPSYEEGFKEGVDAERLLDTVMQEIAAAEQRNLERSLERLARDLDEASRFQELLKEDAADSAGDVSNLAETGRQQESLKGTIDDLAKDAEAIAPKVRDEHPEAGEKVKEVAEQLASGDIQDAMERAVEKLGSGDISGAQPEQEEARKDLREAANLAAEALRSLSKTEKEKLLEAIAKAKEAVAEQRGLNRAQEEIEADPTPSADQKRTKAAQLSEKQGAAGTLVQEIVTLLDDLATGDKYQPDSKDFREARREMATAERYLSEGNLANASSSGELAEERLAKGLEDLQKLYGQALLEDLAQAIGDADRLKSDEKRVRERTDALTQDDPTEGQREKTALQQKWVGDDAGALEDKLATVVEQAGTAGSEARERIEQAKETLGSEEFKSAVEGSRTDIVEGRADDAMAKQDRVLERIDAARADLERAYKILTTSELERLWESATALTEAREQLESMRNGEPSDEEMDSLAEQLTAEGENLSENAETKTAGEHAKKAGEILSREHTSTDPGMEDTERIETAAEQLEQALDTVVQRIDVLVKARKVLLPKDETCPPEYQALVEYYYRVLSEF